jgi:hypothetical protein
VNAQRRAEVKSVLTPKLFALLVLFGAFMGLVGVLTTPFVPSWLGWSTLLSPTSTPLIVLFILLLLAQFAGITVSREKLVLLAVAGAMGVSFCYSWVPYAIIHNSAAARLYQYNWHPTNWAVVDYWVFGPIVSDPAEMTPIQTGGPVPWGKWAPFLAWWITYTVLWLLFFTGWISLLQERWMIVERLPYPVAIPVTMQIALASAPRGKDPRIRFFLLGALIGALVILPVIATYINPAIPDIYGWSREPFIPWWLGCIDFSRTPLGPVIVPISVLPLNPSDYVAWYIVPSKISFTVWFLQLFLITVPSQVAYYMGYYSDLPTMANRFHAFMNGAPFRWNGWYVGAAFGLILIWFVLNWKYMKEVFTKTEQSMPAKLRTWMIVGSTVGLIGLLVAAGVNAIAAPLIVLSMWLIYIGAVRQMGLSYVTAVPGDWTQLPTLVKYLYIPDPGYVTINGAQARPPEMVVTMWLANRPTAVIFGYGGIISSIPISYKAAFDNGVNLRDVTKLILAIGIVSAIIGYPVALWFSYTVGTNNTRMGMFDSWWHWVFGCPWSKVEEQFITEPLAPYLLAGFALIALVSFLNFRFVWWPIDPVGTVVALGGGFATGYILPAFIGWLVKRLVYRIGGAKLDENVGMPFAIGFIVGYLMCQVIGGIIVTVQYFLPK